MVQVYGFPSTLAAPISFLILLFIFGFIAEAAHQGYIVFPCELFKFYATYFLPV